MCKMSATTVLASTQDTLYNANTMVLAQELNLRDNGMENAPHIGLVLPQSLEETIRNVAIFFLFIWVFHIITKAAKVGRGGNVIQEIGGWGKFLTATALLVACLSLNTTIKLANVVVALAWWVLNAAFSVFPGR